MLSSPRPFSRRVGEGEWQGEVGYADGQPAYR